MSFPLAAFSIITRDLALVSLVLFLLWRNGESSGEQETEALLASVKARLGILVRSVTNKEVERYGLESEGGVVITWIESSGPLGKAGFEVGDLILKIIGDGHEI